MANILFLLTTYPGVGGIEKVTNYIANVLVKYHHVSIASCMQVENPAMLNVLDKRINCYLCPNHNYNHLSKENITFVNGIVKSERITHIIFQDSYSNFYKILKHIEGRKAIKIIGVEHNTPLCFLKVFKSRDYKCGSIINGLLNGLQQIRTFYGITKHHSELYNLCNHYVLLSDTFIRDFKKVNYCRKKKAVAINNPLTINLVPVTSAINREKEMLFVGRLTEQKGIDYLLEIWKCLSPLVPDYKLSILGEGELRDMVNAYITENNLRNISVLGYQSDMIPFYQRSQFLLMTSRFEGWGLVLTEAMAYGCVPFAFDSYASVYDIITPDVGEIIPSFDCVEYVQRIMDVINDNSRWKKMSMAGMERARTNFSMDVVLQKWMQLID